MNVSPRPLAEARAQRLAVLANPVAYCLARSQARLEIELFREESAQRLACLVHVESDGLVTAHGVSRLQFRRGVPGLVRSRFAFEGDSARERAIVLSVSLDEGPPAAASARGAYFRAGVSVDLEIARQEGDADAFACRALLRDEVTGRRVASRRFTLRAGVSQALVSSPVSCAPDGGSTVLVAVGVELAESLCPAGAS
jgi:hypothetical protein